MLDDGATDYTDTVLLRELNDALTTKFERLVLDARANYWIDNFDYTTTAGQATYRLPGRNIGVSKVELGGASPTSSGFIRLPQVYEHDIGEMQSPTGSQDQPLRYVIRGDRIVLDPVPNTGYTLRVWYYMRPSRLIPTQIPAGVISVIGTFNSFLTTGGIPTSVDSSGSSTALATGSFVDIISPTGWHELQVTSARVTSVSGATVTLDTAVDISTVQVGDYIRAADQSDIPQLPDDFHRTIVDIASVKILIQRDFQPKAGGYAQDASADLSKFSLMIADRVMEEPPTFTAYLPSLRGGRYWGPSG